MRLYRVLSILLFILFIDYALSEYNLTIVHISDFHSHWFEFDENEGICTESESEAGKCFGGFPRLLTFVRDIRSKEENVVVLSSGEFFLGRSLYALHGWKIANVLLPRLKLDAMSLANHDFSSGVFELSAFLYGMKFPVLCANMRARETSFLYSRVNRSAVLDVHGEKVGIIGYLHPEALEKSRKAASVKFYPEIPSIEKEVRLLESQGIDKIIALGHSGYYTDLDIARSVKGVDVVIGGDSDIVLEEPDDENDVKPSIGNIHGNYPRIHHHETVNDTERNKTLVLHVPQHGKYVGVVRVTFDDYGKIIHESGEPVLLDSSIPQDEETLDFLRNATVALEEHARNSRLPDEGEVLTVADDDFGSRKCRMEECSLGNLVTDAMLQTYIDHEREEQTDLASEQWGLVDAVVFNSGSIRYPLSAGEITISDLLYSIYSGDFMIRVRMSGEQLQKMLEHSVEKYDPMGVTAPGSFLQMSGLRVVYDLDKAPGNRVSKLSIRCRGCLTTTLIPIDPHKTYFVAMPGFMTRGGDGYPEYKAMNSEDYGQPEILLIVHYLRAIQSIKPVLDGRISFVNKPTFGKNISSKKAEDFNTTSLVTPFSATTTRTTTVTTHKNKSKGYSPYLEKNYTYISLMLDGNTKNIYKMGEIENSTHEGNVTSETKEKATLITATENNSSLKTRSHTGIENSNDSLLNEKNKTFLTTNISSFDFNTELTGITTELNGTKATLIGEISTNAVPTTSEKYAHRLITIENNSSLKTTSSSENRDNDNSTTEEKHQILLFAAKQNSLEPSAEVTAMASSSITTTSLRETNTDDSVNATSNAKVNFFSSAESNTKSSLITEKNYSIDESKAQRFQEADIAENLINPRLTSTCQKEEPFESVAVHNSVNNTDQTLSTEQMQRENYSTASSAISSSQKANPILSAFENALLEQILVDFNVSALLANTSDLRFLGQDLKQRLKNFFRDRMEVTTLNPLEPAATKIINRIKEHYTEDHRYSELRNESSRERDHQTENANSLSEERHHVTDSSMGNSTSPSLLNLNRTDHMEDHLDSELHNRSSGGENNEIENADILPKERHHVTDSSMGHSTSPSLFNSNRTHHGSIETSTDDRKKMDGNPRSGMNKSVEHSSEVTDSHLRDIETVTDLLVDVVFNSIMEKLGKEFDSKTSTLGSNGLLDDIVVGKGINKTEKPTIESSILDKKKKTTPSPKVTTQETEENNFIGAEKGNNENNLAPVATPVVKDVLRLEENSVLVFNSTGDNNQNGENEVEWFPWLRF